MPVTYAKIDRRLVMRKVTDLLLADGTLIVYATGEQPEENPGGAVAQIVGIDYQADRTVGGTSPPDTASISIIISVWVKRALTDADAFRLDTAVSRVEQAVSEKTVADGVHTISTWSASVSYDTAPDPASHARSAGVIINGTVSRSSGATLE